MVRRNPSTKKERTPTRRQPTRISKIITTMDKARIAKTKKTKRQQKEDKLGEKAFKELMERSKYETLPSIFEHETKKRVEAEREKAEGDYGYLKRREKRLEEYSKRPTYIRTKRTFKFEKGGKKSTRKLHTRKVHHKKMRKH